MINVGLVFGGPSSEHEVSIRSAECIFNNIDLSKYNIKLIYITKNYTWHLVDKEIFFNKEYKLNKELEVSTKNKKLHLGSSQDTVDIVLPIIHGPFGEDGTLQGYFKALNVPFCGCSLISSAICMDKEICKKVLAYSGVKNSKFLSYRKQDISFISRDYIFDTLGKTIFVKPASQGSSIGVSKATNSQELEDAYLLAFKYDDKVIFEEEIKGRELECSVIGNDQLFSSEIGEVVINSKDGFYSYDAKYILETEAATVIPAELTKDEKERLKETAEATYKLLDCSGFARVDMFLTEKSEIYVNEVNTLPGFTAISMFPKLFNAVDMNTETLIDNIIDLGFKSFNNFSELSLDRI